MTQSTFSAQVANNLLKVLQGYYKGIRLIALLTMLCTMGVGQIWAETYKLTKVTSVSAGAMYVFEQDGYVMNNSVSSSALQCTNSYKTTGLVGTETYVWTLETATSGFYMKNVSKSSSQYLNNSSSTGVSFGNKSSIWKFTFADGIAVIQNTSNSNRFLGYTNSTSHAYKAYATSNMSGDTYPHDITVYKLEVESSTPTPVDPTATFSNGEYTVGGAALDLSTLWESDSDGTVTYSVKTNGGTGASISGTSFTATTAGSCTVQASQAATTGYNAITKTATITVNPAQGGGSGSGDNYTITFATGINTTATTSSVQLSTMISDGDENVKSFVVDGTDKYVYHKGAGASNATGSGLRLGKSGGKGKITFNLSDEIAAQNLSSISVTTAAWDASTTVSLVVNGSATTTANAGNTIAYTPSTTTKLSSITLSATARAFIKTITITTSSSAEPTQLPAPTGLTATNITSTSATLSWNAVANASSYVVQILDDGNTNIEQSTTNTTITVTGLNPSTLHYWGVTAVGDGTNYTNSNESNTSEFTTEAASTPTYYTITLNPNYPEGEKGTFIDTVGNAVDGDLKISWLGETKTTPIANLYSSISLDGYIFEGWYEITAEGEKNRKNTGTITSDTTFYARWKVPYTVTFNAGTGECDPQSITETTTDGIKLPAATLTDCDDWTFLGWAEAAIASETTTPPASLAEGSTYKPTGNIILYAIYKRVEGGGGEEDTEATLTFDDTSKRTTLTTEQQVWEENNITLINDKASSTSNIIDSSNPTRFYKNSKITVSAPETITKIVATTSGSEYTTALKNSVGAEASANGNVVTITPTESNTTYTIQLTGGQVRLKSITVTYGGGLSTSYYHSNPYCQRCENILTISKGVETNGTFTLDISGEIETCETEVSIVVKPTSANHYHIGSVTATTPTTGDAPTVTDNDNGTYTITYAANSTGASTINVTFAEDAKATIKLYELGVLTTITTEYVGDKYTLPSTSSQSCGTKTLVGWSTVAFAETDTRPTENYYGISTQITLAETQTFYAVFAQSSGGGDGSGDYVRVTEALDNWSGDYLIAYNDQTFANGSTGGKEGMGAEGNKENLSSHINNNTIPASIGDLYNVTLVAIDGGYVLQTKDGKYNYYTSGTDNGLSATGSLETASKYPIVIDFKSSEDIELHIIKEGERLNSVFSYNATSPGYFRFYKNGGQEPVYLYKKSGTAATYTGYTTSCAVITGIEVANPKTDFKQYDEFVFGGTVYAVDENDKRIDVTSSATFSGYDMKKAGTDTVTVTYNSHSTTYKITIEEVNAYALTWNVSGATNTGLAPAYVVPGNAIGKLPTPKEIPAGCEGKTFVGWTESNVVNEDGTDITFIKSTTVPSQATTYYAVFARPSGNAGDGDYVKVTKDANDLSGEYLIVYEAGNLAFNGGLTTLDAESNTISVTINDNTIASTDATNAAKFTIAKDGEGDYTIKSASGKYIGKTANDNDLEESESTPYKNTITFTDGDVNIIASGGAYLRYNKNSGAERFRYYKSGTYTGQQPIALYKKSGSSASYTSYTTGCHDVTITYYGFTGGCTTNCGGSDLNVITQRVNSSHTIPNCTEITDPTTLGRTFLNLWKDQNGKEHKPGDSFIVTEDITLYAQWKLETTGDIELPADKEDLATTDIIVTGGKTLTIPEGKIITINSLTLKGGLLVEDDKVSGYAMPVVNIPTGATLVRKNTTINLDLVVNNDSWYPFAVSFEVENTAANVNYINPKLKEYANAHNGYGKYYRILEYDGAKRAEKGLNNDSNWVHVGRTDVKLMPGKGYAISAVPAAGDDTVTIRITMNVDNEWLANGEQKSITVKETTTTRNQVTVTAHKGTAASKDICNAGWNFVANPYLTNFTTNNHITGVEYIGGEIIVSNGQFVKDGTEVPYVTIPNANMSWYEQRRVEDAILSPMYSFFVQIAEGGTMTFTTDGRQQAPAALRASSEQANPSFEADIVILNSQEQEADHTGLVINDRWSPAYEIGGDLEKMFGNANRTAIYTLSGSTRLAYNALSYNDALVAIPIGFRAQADGEYTIQLSNTEDIVGVECIELKDLYNNQTTNLLYTDYTFYSDATQEDSRFVVYIVPQKNTPTDISTIINGNTENRKIIFNNHLYIIHNGNIYNGAGQMVK